jgi:hypothetical protein
MLSSSQSRLLALLMADASTFSLVLPKDAEGKVGMGEKFGDTWARLTRHPQAT